MTPAARHSAGIEILDAILAGKAAEQVLTNWARRNRYAGSGDRAAIRDLVFDVLRKQRSCTAAGGSNTGRGLVLGHVRLLGIDTDEIFSGQGYGPTKLSEQENTHIWSPKNWTTAVRLNYPDWLEDDLQTSLGDDLVPNLEMMQDRAKAFLRVNARKATLTEVIEILAEDQISARSHPLVPTALVVEKNPRRITANRAYQSGLVELQDLASQAVVLGLEVPKTGRILDYCAGGGGKTLAMAAQSKASFHAYDADPGRMQDLPKRAARAGVSVKVLTRAELSRQAPFDLVLCDVPCSGSGAWRRSPASKWQLNRQGLDRLLQFQQDILNMASGLVANGGSLAYATCSILKSENQDQITRFLGENPLFSLESSRAFTPLDGGDGLFYARLRHN